MNRLFKLCLIAVVSMFVYINPFGQIEAYANTFDLHFNNYVADEANILSDVQEMQLNNMSIQLEQKTKAELAIVTLKSLKGKSIEDVGLAIGRDYGIGKKKTNNGIVIIVAPNDRKMRIEVGYGLEGAIPDSVAGRVRDSYMISNFKEGKYFDGIYEASQALSFKIAKSMNIELSGISDDVQSNEEMNDWINQHPLRFLAIIVFALFLVVILGAIFGSGSGGGYSGGYYSGGSSGGFGGGSSFGGGSFGGGGCSGGW